jgi:Peptidase family M28
VRFVLFDGEEPAAGLPEESTDFYNEGLRGSRAYVARHPGRTAAMILLDYVGHRGLRLPREGSSTPALWARVRSAARAVGAARFFPDDTGATIVDDHTPFLRAGVPAVDLIDWSYPGHDLSDGLDQLSRRSLDAVGETVVEAVSQLRSRTSPGLVASRPCPRHPSTASRDRAAGNGLLSGLLSGRSSEIRTPTPFTWDKASTSRADCTTPPLGEAPPEASTAVHGRGLVDAPFAPSPFAWSNVAMSVTGRSLDLPVEVSRVCGGSRAPRSRVVSLHRSVCSTEHASDQRVDRFRGLSRAVPVLWLPPTSPPRAGGADGFAVRLLLSLIRRGP